MASHSPASVESGSKVSCVCCGTKNDDHGGYCSNCMAPVELSRTVISRGTPAQFLTVLGASAAGKTVYLGMLLDILSQGARGLRGLPNGAFSVNVQQQTISALQNRRFPEKTPNEADNWRWVHCEITRERRKKRPVDLITPDFAGEAIAVELEHHGTFETIRTAVSRSHAMMLLIDSQRVRDQGRDEDYFAMKLASYISNLHAPSSWRLRKQLALPIAVILTKSDSCPEALADPTAFAQAHLPGFVNYCNRNFRRYRFFAAGVVGSSATVMNSRGQRLRIPLHVQPQGVIEPLEWVIKQL